eukprot:COSAG05_NODE_14692_length_390_cov_0.707904_1_plen_48_part_10
MHHAHALSASQLARVEYFPLQSTAGAGAGGVQSGQPPSAGVAVANERT